MADNGGHLGQGVITPKDVHVEENPATRARYIGAKAHTNNTGELTALYNALATALRRRPGVGREEIWADSLYAINMASGKWMPKSKRNSEIVEHMRQLWRRLQRARPGEVEVKHVRSHIKHPGNEVADWLADRGRMDDTTTVTETRHWLDTWLRKEQGRAHNTTPNTLGDPTGVG